MSYQEFTDYLREKTVPRGEKTALANFLGISQSAMSRYINGDYRPKYHTVIGIAEFYNVSYSDYGVNR